MHLVIRKCSEIRSISLAARRAESGIGAMLKQAPGFRGYYVFDAGHGVGGSVTLFEDRETGMAANAKALAWIRESLSDLMDGEPEITAGETVVAMTPERN